MAACHAMNLPHSIAMRPNLELNSQPIQLLGSLPLDLALPILALFQKLWGGGGGVLKRYDHNGRVSAVNRMLDGSTYPG